MEVYRLEGLQRVGAEGYVREACRFIGAFLFLISRTFSNFLVSDSVVDLETADLKY